MSTADAVFSGSIPALYDQVLGPFIFEPYAADTARRVAAFAPAQILETAAGTGIVTRRMIEALPSGVRITATDLNQPMLDHAARQTTSDRIQWQQADAQALPFADAAFDAVVCQFGVMFFPGRQKAYREARRVLRPGGLFLFTTWDHIQHNEIPHEVAKAVAALFPDDPPRFLERTPHGYHQASVILDDARQAGFANASLQTVTLRSIAASPRDPAVGFCQGSPLRNEIERRDAGRLAEAIEAATEAVRARFGDGPIEGKIQAHIVTATR